MAGIQGIADELSDFIYFFCAIFAHPAVKAFCAIFLVLQPALFYWRAHSKMYKKNSENVEYKPLIYVLACELKLIYFSENFHKKILEGSEYEG